MHRTRISTAFTLTVMCGAAMAAVSPPAFAAGTNAMDETYLRTIHQGNLAEIAAGEDAQDNATTDCVREVGKTFIRDHSNYDADIRTLAAKLHVSLPAGPSPDQKKTLASLQAKADTPAYDKAWSAAQDAAHIDALALIDKEIANGSNKEVVAAAKAARPVVAMHEAMVRGGTCHMSGRSMTVHAGFGTSPAGSGPGSGDGSASTVNRVGAAALGTGGVLSAAAAAWYVGTRRRERSTARG